MDIDISLYDLSKMFDAMWYQETLNDMWDVGLQDDKFALMARMNKECSVAVKTPAGITDRFTVQEIEMQGTVAGPIKACVQVDTLGRDCYLYNEGLYLYKNCVKIPPLGMVDDIASISLCGIDSIKMNAIINSKIDSKKLEFGPSKCYNIHVGKKVENCCDLKVQGKVMKRKESEVYLGDIICSSGTNDKNIAKKVNQGIGAVSEIFSTLSQVSLGHFYYEIALMFRDANLVSKLVSSSEVWYDVKKHEYKKLENIDEMFFRRMLEVPISVPKEGIYIEMGKMPVKYVIRIRRLMYWWHLVNLNSKEVLQKVYSAQKLNSSKGDWVVQLETDKKELKLNITDEELKNYKQEEFKMLIKRKVEILAGKHLEELRKSHSKTEKLVFNGFTPAAYLLSKNLTVHEVKTLFKLRTRMINVKANFSSNQDNLWCKACLLFKETQEHLI